MNRLAFAAIIGGLIGGTSVGAADNAIVGYVSDAKCATASAKAKTAGEWIKPAAFESCVKDCVKAGSELVFVTADNKILTFSDDSKSKVTPLAGHKVSVVGKVEGTTLKVDRITGLELK